MKVCDWCGEYCEGGFFRSKKSYMNGDKAIICIICHSNKKVIKGLKGLLG